MQVVKVNPPCNTSLKQGGEAFFQVGVGCMTLTTNTEHSTEYTNTDALQLYICMCTMPYSANHRRVHTKQSLN